MKSYKHQTHSKNNGIRLAAVVSSAIMMAPLAMGTVSTFADGTNNQINPSTTTSTTAATSSSVSQLTTDYSEFLALNTGTAYTLLDSNNLQTLKNDADLVQKVIYSPTSTTDDIQKADILIKGATTSLQTLLNAASTTAKTALQTQLTAYTNAYTSLSSTQQSSLNGMQLKADLAATTTAVNGYSVTPNQAGSLIDKLSADLTALGGSTTTTSAAASDTQQTVIDASNAAKKEYTTVPTFLQGSDEYIKLGNVIDATADDANNKNISKPDATLAVKNLDEAIAAMKKLVSASVVYSGVGTIRYPKNYGIQVWTIGGKMVKNSNGTAKKLKGGTKWKVYGPILNINGSKMYNLGGDQFIDANYVSFAAKK